MQPITTQPPGAPSGPPAPPPLPALPATQLPGEEAVVVLDGGQPAVGAADAATLRARRSELSRQLSSADGRRKELVSQLRNAPEGAQAGLVDRIQVLDQRIVQIEQAIAQNGRALASLPATTTSTMEDDMPSSMLEDGQITAITIVFIIFVLMPLAVAYGRTIWKRASMPRPPALPAATEQRLERLEQGVDAIAVEVERISEGQRFVTRLLSEGAGATAVGAPGGGRVPERVAERLPTGPPEG